LGLFNELKRLTKPYDDEDDFDDFQPKMTDELPLAENSGTGKKHIRRL